MANEQKGEMNDRFDQARVAPRPHEHAWFLQSAAAKAMGELLRKGQSTLPWDKIVALADNPTDFPVGAPLKVKCSCCGARRNFDFVFGTLQRLQHEATVARRENQTTREASFLDSPAIIKFNNTVVPKAVAAIEKQCATRRKAPKMDDMLWPQCTNCEADEAMAAFRVQQPTSARKAAESLGLGPKKPKVGAPRTLDCAVPIHGTELVQMLPKSVQNAEELAIPDKLSMGILLVEKEPLAALLSERHCSRYEDLVGAPDVHNLFAEPTSIGQEVETRKAAGGDDVDAAAVIVAPKALIDTLQHREKHERADAFRALWLQPHNGMEAVGFALLNNELPDAGDILTEQREFFAKRNERIRGHTDEQIDAKCETQRVGKVTSWASLLRNPDFVDYSRMWGVAGGREHVNHMLLVVKPGGDLSHALLIYPSGPRGRASKKLQKAARRCDGAETRCDDQWGRPKKRQKTEKDIARLRLCYGQPRSVVVVPGRPFFDASLSENRALQQHDGPFGQRARVLAHCGLISMLALAAMGLAPRPDEDKDEWLNVRNPLVLGDGIAHTAVYTWRCLELHAKAPRLAIHALACIQGFYENFYRACPCPLKPTCHWEWPITALLSLPCATQLQLFTLIPIGTAAWSKCPSWRPNTWSSKARETATVGLILLSVHRRRGTGYQILPRGCGYGAVAARKMPISLLLTIQALGVVDVATEPSVRSTCGSRNARPHTRAATTSQLWRGREQNCLDRRLSETVARRSRAGWS